MVKTIVGLISAGLFVSGIVAYQNHEALPIPHAPHSTMQYSVEKFMAGQHGPNVECKRFCAPAGFEDETREDTDLEVVTCAGHTNPEQSCARQGEQCGKEHRPGCAEHCRDQCCTCCSI